MPPDLSTDMLPATDTTRQDTATPNSCPPHELSSDSLLSAISTTSRKSRLSDLR